MLQSSLMVLRSMDVGFTPKDSENVKPVKRLDEENCCGFDNIG